MTGIYYTNLIDVLNAAGLICRVEPVNAGWERRARSSGGFPSTPLAVFWHHTASKTTPQNDLAYMISAPDAPIGNILIDRQGFIWPIAAGASNCAGVGGPVRCSRGTIPENTGNTRGFQIEVANNGIGEAWPEAQIRAYFQASNALNKHFGNRPTDVITHAKSDGEGWTTRKIDPARAASVLGSWVPRSVNSSGTWNLSDVKAECLHRASATPPTPEPPKPPEPTYPPPIPAPPPNDPPLRPIEIEDDMKVMQQGTRVLDTRRDGGPFDANETRDVDLKADEPISAAMVNLTAINPKAKGFLTVWGVGVRPDTSALQLTAGENDCNAVIVPTEGDVIHVYSSVPTDLIVEVQATW